ncbi:hypothetical protein HZH68_007158 [Vespula germanica]|uniref:Uncharacterized protein n=1 Tax=Vespula germanica TaxID=30212 RepID=A0A834K761_VESGE|nr:hypothetical protein HZH68_007158 [Vespula germanica]
MGRRLRKVWREVRNYRKRDEEREEIGGGRGGGDGGGSSGSGSGCGDAGGGCAKGGGWCCRWWGKKENGGEGGENFSYAYLHRNNELVHK